MSHRHASTRLFLLAITTLIAGAAQAQNPILASTNNGQALTGAHGSIRSGEADRSLYIRPIETTIDLTVAPVPLGASTTRIVTPPESGASQTAKSRTTKVWKSVNKKALTISKKYSVHRRHEHAGYTVDVRYPQFRGTNPDLVKKLNQKIRSIVNGNIPGKPGEFADSLDYEYSCDYRRCFFSDSIVSGELQFQNDSGGASGITTAITFNYSLSDNLKELALEDILGKSVDRNQLSKLCISKLLERYPDELYDECEELLLRDETYSKFTVDKCGVSLTFEQGDLAPNALGCPRIELSYVEIEEMLSRKHIAAAKAK